MSTLAWTGALRDRDRLLRLLQEYGVYAALALLFLVAVGLNSDFLSAGNVRIQLFQVAPTLLVALGMALVIGTEGIDLSVGAVVALAAAVVPLYLGYGLAFALLIALLLGALSGAVGGAMVAFTRVQPIVATLSLMIGVRGLAEIVNGDSAKPVTDTALLDLGSDSLAGIPLMAWITALCALAVGLVVRRTTFGRRLVAIGDNRQASRLAGLPVRRVLLTVYMVSGVLAALAGVMIVGHGAEADPANQGLNMELNAITAVLTQHNVPNSYTQIVEAAIICCAVYASQERGTR